MRSFYPLFLHCSYLKGLVPSFNSLVDDFLEKLKPLADGKTVVPLKDHIQSFVLEVVSKVSKVYNLPARVVRTEFGIECTFIKGTRIISYFHT